MMKQQLPNPRRRGIETLIHIIVWGIVIGFPFLMMTRSGFNISLADYLRHGSSSTLSFFLVFYINYCLLIPRYLFEGRIRQYLLLNTLLIICITTGAHLWQEYTFQNHLRGDDDGQHMGPPKWIFILRDVSTMILTAGLSAAIKLSRRWAQMDAARREAEKSRTEAELKNLRNQLNPHFLLNTLNNIYALIAFDADKAQTAVQELSRLLRHVLYDNQQNFVTLDKEMDFIRNYIELRGIGVIDVQQLFGMRAVMPESQIDLVVEFEPWDSSKAYDRLGIEDRFIDILGKQVPCVTLPIRPGRNLASIVEVAAMNNRHRRYGYNAAEELARKVDLHADLGSKSANQRT